MTNELLRLALSADSAVERRKAGATWGSACAPRTCAAPSPSTQIHPGAASASSLASAGAAHGVSANASATEPARILDDAALTVRLQAVATARRLGLGEALAEALLAALASPTWTIRWHAAAALATTRHRERTAAVFAGSFPERAPPHRAVHVETWRRLAAAFTPLPPEIAARLAAISPAR